MLPHDVHFHGSSTCFSFQIFTGYTCQEHPGHSRTHLWWEEDRTRKHKNQLHFPLIPDLPMWCDPSTRLPQKGSDIVYHPQPVLLKRFGGEKPGSFLVCLISNPSNRIKVNHKENEMPLGCHSNFTWLQRFPNVQSSFWDLSCHEPGTHSSQNHTRVQTTHGASP